MATIIRIRLLGGAKKAVGKPSIDLERDGATTVSEILQFLQSVAAEPRLLQPGNLLVAVNGVDSSAIAGGDTQVRGGDSVTVVTVVHGGAGRGMPAKSNGRQVARINGSFVFIAGAAKVPPSQDPGKIVDQLRAKNPQVSVQAANAGSVYGATHALGVLQIALEAEKRGVMLASRRLETEVLLRLACTTQISEAISRAGLKAGEAGCFIAISKERGALVRFAGSLENAFELDDSVLEATKEKRRRMEESLPMLMLSSPSSPSPTGGRRAGGTKKMSDGDFTRFLVERAAVLVR